MLAAKALMSAGRCSGTVLFWIARMVNGVRFFVPSYWKIEARVAKSIL
jgi:hypothetical protein